MKIKMNIKKPLIVVTALLLIVFSIQFTPAVFAAKPSDILDVVVTNFPEIFKNREQNLDSNGNIKVHEQGTVSVTVGNTSPIPVTVQGATPSASPLAAKVVKVFDNTPINPGQTMSQPIDVSGYRKMTVQVFRAEPQSRAIVSGQYSIDGVSYSTGTPNFSVDADGGHPSLFQTVDVPAPYLKVQIDNLVAIPTPSISVYLYLIP